ncbi:hypothetical protein UVI_02029500 [Ustilaginoidea virens]|uniref:Rossmann-fold NAD(P)(+)-binding protein n=1 Tax=Ustilaginoidea virens TaxID=1159556 RepID=A0A1B5KYF2_USTVR|nr:hypothetical protein UVI_02029500 [Ustilaginoidea virens]
MARIHQLEMLRQAALHKTNSITRDEQARLMQLRMLTMRDENSDLREQLGQRDYKMMALTRDTDQLRLDLDHSKQTVRAQEARLKKQDIDMASLKSEIEALNVSMQDSGKVLQEKFALARELDRLKPELEHLQSQLATFQETVAEKNNLRRQLDSVEVELENEKRSRQLLQSTNDDDAAMAELTCRLQDAEKKLAAEKKERQRAEREHERELAATKAENERLEERISSLKEKSRSLAAELKATREQLDDDAASETAVAVKAPSAAGRSAGEKPKKAMALAAAADVGKKRRAPAMSFEEVTIQTPGNDAVARERPAKRRGIEKSAVGEKSAFSVTPFLNRNKSLSGTEESPNMVGVGAEEEPASDAAAAPEPPSPSESEEEAPKPKVSFKSSVSVKSPAKATRRRGRPPKATPLAESTPAKANRAIRSKGTTPKIKSIPEVCVDKSGHDSGAADQENAPVAAARKASALAQPKADEPEAKRKKRKLLGAANTTLFDDDDNDAEAQPKAQPPAAGKRTRARLGGGVARERTRPHGLVIGIDLIPAQPPQGVATFQGDFLSPSVRQLVKEFIHRTQSQAPLKQDAADAADEEDPLSQPLDQPSYIDKERHASEAQSPEGHAAPAASSVDVRLPIRPAEGSRPNSSATMPSGRRGGGGRGKGS